MPTPGRSVVANLVLGLVYLVFLCGFGSATLLFTAPVVAAIPVELRSRSFPSVMGTVIESEVVDPDDPESEPYARVVVEYRVAGATHRTDRIHFGGYGGSLWETEEGIVRKYPEGETVPVYYDPMRVGRAALENGVRWDQIAALAFLFPFMLLTLMLVSLPGVLFLRRNEPDTPITITDLGTMRRFRAQSPQWGFAMLGGSILGTFAAIAAGMLFGRSIGNVPALAGLVWGVQLAVTSRFGIKAYREDRSGYRDVMLDRSTRHFIFPPVKAFGEPTRLSVADVERFSLERSRTSESKELGVIVHLRDGNTFLGAGALPQRCAEALLAALTAELTPRG